MCMGSSAEGVCIGSGAKGVCMGSSADGVCMGSSAKGVCMGSIVQKEFAWEGAHSAFFIGRSMHGVCMVYLVRSGRENCEGSVHGRSSQRICM
jgi:hypothetical protein